jgi:hypothetical protein
MKSHFARWMLAVVFLLTAVLPAAWGATLQLKNGRMIQGEYMGGTAATVNFLVNGQLLSYPVSDIMLIDLTQGNAATVAPSATTSSAAESAPPPADSAMPSNKVTVPAGTRLYVRMIDSIDTSQNRVGDKFQASLEQPLVVGDRILAPKDALVYGQIAESRQAGRYAGRSELRLELTGIEVNGQVVPISTGAYDLAGKSRGKQTAERTGIGAGAGALLGALIGGGKGALAGAAIGGGGATAIQVMTHGQQLHIPSETELEFTVAQPFAVQVTS